MKPIGITLSALAVMVLTLASGVIYGNLSQRWGPPQEMLEAAKKLETIPTEFGDWRLKKANTFNKETLEMLRCAGYISRIYENRVTNETVNVAVIVGPPGQISVHTPEVCFSSQDYTHESQRQKNSISRGGRDMDDFWFLTFQTNDLYARKLSVAYGWSTGGNWLAVDDPRFKYGGYPYLYKIQLAADMSGGSKDPQKDPCLEFLEDFVPAAKKSLIEAHKR